MYSLARRKFGEALYCVIDKEIKGLFPDTEEWWVGRTADRNADVVALRVEDSDVHIGREITALHPGGEGRVHVVRVGVDVKLVAIIFMSRECIPAGGSKRHSLSDGHDIVGKVKHELVGLRRM